MSRSTLPAPVSSSVPQPIMMLPSPRTSLVAGRFELRGLIGVGGMGSVYRARDITLDEMVALKVIAREIAREPGMLERFRREVKLARRVTHPNVARCFDIGQDGDDRFFTMELVEGESLGARMAREQRLSPASTIGIALEVCAGLGAAHRAGVVHRDLKPDNVLLAADGRVVLTDFGIASARLANDGASRTVGIIVGTPEYMAPEQVEGVRDLDGRADIYSLGAMMFELVTGCAAWTGPSSLAIVAARLAMEPPDPRKYAAVDDALAEVILRCMARRREDRFADVDKVASALRGAGATIDRSHHDGSTARFSPDEVPSRVDDRAALREKSVMVFSRSDEDDVLGHAVADGLGDLVERHLRGATALRVVAGSAVRTAQLRHGSERASGTDAARELGAAVIIDTTVAMAGESVAVDVEVVNVIDGLVLSSRQHTGRRSQLFAVAAEIARDVAEMLLAGHTPTLPGGIGDGETLDLWLRARVESRMTAPFAMDRAVALFERAIARTPDDLWILAGYAATLVDRFRDAETPSSDLKEALSMAERVIGVTDALGEAWLARATARLELGDPCGAVTDLARAGRVMPGYARVRAMRGRMLLEAGVTARAERHLDRATVLEPALFEPRLDRALAAGMAGAFDQANAIVDEVLSQRGSPAEGWLVAARLALWSADRARALALRNDLAGLSLGRSERAGYVLDAVIGDPSAVGMDYFAWLAEADPPAARRTAAALRVEAELAMVGGDLVHALQAVDSATSTRGFVDLAWLDGCPLLEPIRHSPRFVAMRSDVETRCRDMLEIIDATREES
jgi:TolB-like protein